MFNLFQDLKFALWMLRKNPGFTCVAVLTLALGIGANAAIFSAVHTVLLKPLPYPDSDRLVSLSAHSFTKFTQIHEQTHTLQATAAYFSFGSSLQTPREPEAIQSAHISLDFFHVLGITPARGRSFLPEEQQPGGANVVILSDGFWHNHFAGDESIIGKPLVLDGSSTTVVGILPATFRFPFEFPEPNVWLPRVFEHPLLKPPQVQLGAGYLSVIGRLREDQTLSQAQAELDTIDARYRQQFANFADASKDHAPEITSLAESLVGGLRSSLLVLLAAVGFVLLIACANVANLLLARATAREKEIALRKTLGASRGRLVAQMLSESFVLSLLGSALGVALALALIPVLRSLKQANLPRLAETRMDSPVLFFSMALCVLTAALFGVAPALQAAGKQLHDALKEGVRGSSAGRRGKVRGALVVAEMAVALILITGAGLFAESFARLLQVNLGFSPQGVTTFPVILPSTRYARPEQQTEFFRQALQRVRSLPAVQSAAFVSFLPLSGGYRLSYFCAEGQICQGLGKDPLLAFWQVTSGYFETMRAPLLRGRYYDKHDVAGGAPVVIVNETAAKHFWPNENPLGKHIAGSRDLIQREVVGVVADAKFSTLQDASADQLFVPSEQMPYPAMTLVVRSSANSEPLVAAVRAKLAELDPTLPVSGILSMDTVIASSVAQPRLIMQLVSAFAVFALLLAAIGMYGVMAYSVSQRRQEMGIRMSLGAVPRDILSLVVRQGMTLAAGGTLIGVIASFALTRLLSSLLFHVRAADPLIFASAALVLVASALAACYIPARRATRVDPIIILRYE
jgi:putative ABC transport system permease protein